MVLREVASRHGCHGVSLVAVVGSAWSNYLALPGPSIGPSEHPDLQ